MGFKEKILKNHKIPSSYLQTVLIFVGFFMFFLLLSISISISNHSIKLYEYEYSKKCENKATCLLEMDVDQDLSKVFIYYRITNYYQNYRLYLNSKSNTQLTGKEISLVQAQSACGKRATNGQMGKNTSITGKPLDTNAVAFPCGIIAESVFTDSYSISQSGSSTPISIDSINYPFYGVKGNMYKNWNRDKQWADIETSQFIQWMQVAGTSNFYKYYGKVEAGLKKGKYTININNKWDSNKFGGNKYIVISTASGYGGKNTTLETLYWICTALSFAFIVILKVQRIMNNMKIKEKDMS